MLIIVLIIILIIIITLCKFRDISSNKCTDTLPVYNPDPWNKSSEFNNCLAYAIDKLDRNSDHKLQPGELHGVDLGDTYDCNDLLKAFRSDYPDSYVEYTNKPCKCGYHKIFASISPNDENVDEDYHFYRQDKSLLWSHKPGSAFVSNVDGQNHTINNPLNADRHVGDFNYSIPCGFICIAGRNKSIGM
jgi:hypothetical protein